MKRFVTLCLIAPLCISCAPPQNQYADAARVHTAAADQADADARLYAQRIALARRDSLAALSECQGKSMVATISCANDRMTVAYQLAGYQHMDAVHLYTSRTLVLAEQVDRGVLTPVQAGAEAQAAFNRFSEADRQYEQAEAAARSRLWANASAAGAQARSAETWYWQTILQGLAVAAAPPAPRYPTVVNPSTTCTRLPPNQVICQ